MHEASASAANNNSNGVCSRDIDNVDNECSAPIPKPKRNTYNLFICVLASMTSVLLGYDGGVMSGAMIYIKRDLKVSDVQIEILAGIMNIYSLIGAALAGRTSDWIGRRYTALFASALFFVGAILMGFATNYAFLMVGRFVAGVGMGYAIVIAPVFTAEIAPASYRGFVTSFPEISINSGIILGYVSNYAFGGLPLNLGWRVMLGIGAVPSVLLGIGVLFMPESPRWLILQGSLGDAKKVLDKTSDSPQEAQLRFADIKQAAGIPRDCNDSMISVWRKNSGEGVWKELFIHPTQTTRHILLAGVGVAFFHQACGIDALVIYSPTIYKEGGIGNDSVQLLATIGVGVSKTLFILIATFLVDKAGRRVLLLVSCAGVALSQFILATGLTIIDRFGDHKMMWAVAICVAMTFSCAGLFSVGMGPITWVYNSEIFPLRLRAQGCGMAVAINRLVSGVVSMTFISLYKGIGIGQVFYMFAGISVIGWIFFYTLLPETRGRTLEEIDALFGIFLGWRSTMKELKKKKLMEAEERQGFHG